MQKLDGFLALLSVTGGSWPPPIKKLPFSVTCVDGDSSLLYFASIDLAGNNSGGKNVSKSIRSPGKSRFRVPVRGRVQLVCIIFFKSTIPFLTAKTILPQELCFSTCSRWSCTWWITKFVTTELAVGVRVQ